VTTPAEGRFAKVTTLTAGKGTTSYKATPNFFRTALRGGRGFLRPLRPLESGLLTGSVAAGQLPDPRASMRGHYAPCMYVRSRPPVGFLRISFSAPPILKSPNGRLREFRVTSSSRCSSFSRTCGVGPSTHCLAAAPKKQTTRVSPECNASSRRVCSGRR
jgi:hypothetical protein